MDAISSDNTENMQTGSPVCRLADLNTLFSIILICSARMLLGRSGIRLQKHLPGTKDTEILHL